MRHKIKLLSKSIIYAINLAFLEINIAWARQYEYVDRVREEPSVMQKLLTSPAATLMTVLLGTAGVYIYTFGKSKEDRSDSHQLLGFVAVLFVLFMVCYRVSVWFGNYHQGR